MKTEREKKLEIALLKEKLERISGKKIMLKENKDGKVYAGVLSHDDYKDIEISLDSKDVEGYEYVSSYKLMPYNVVTWNDDGPDILGYNNLNEMLSDMTINFFGIDEEIPHCYTDDNKIKPECEKEVLENFKTEVEKSHPDKDSGSGVIVLKQGKKIMGPKSFSSSSSKLENTPPIKSLGNLERVNGHFELENTPPIKSLGNLKHVSGYTHITPL